MRLFSVLYVDREDDYARRGRLRTDVEDCGYGGHPAGLAVPSRRRTRAATVLRHAEVPPEVERETIAFDGKP